MTNFNQLYICMFKQDWNKRRMQDVVRGDERRRVRGEKSAETKENPAMVHIVSAVTDSRTVWCMALLDQGHYGKCIKPAISAYQLFVAAIDIALWNCPSLPECINWAWSSAAAGSCWQTPIASRWRVEWRWTCSDWKVGKTSVKGQVSVSYRKLTSAAQTGFRGATLIHLQLDTEQMVNTLPL